MEDSDTPGHVSWTDVMVPFKDIDGHIFSGVAQVL